MKKMIVALILSVGMISTASAHHLSANPDAGENIPLWSPHLDMVF